MKKYIFNALLLIYFVTFIVSGNLSLFSEITLFEYLFVGTSLLGLAVCLVWSICYFCVRALTPKQTVHAKISKLTVKLWNQERDRYEKKEISVDVFNGADYVPDDRKDLVRAFHFATFEFADGSEIEFMIRDFYYDHNILRNGESGMLTFKEFKRSNDCHDNLLVSFKKDMATG